LQLAAILPAKTVPSCGGQIDSDARNLRKRKGTKPKQSTALPARKKARVAVEDVDDEAEVVSHPSNASENNDISEEGSAPSTSNRTMPKRVNAKVCCIIHSLNNT
jgi:hypothetical protein